MTKLLALEDELRKYCYAADAALKLIAEIECLYGALGFDRTSEVMANVYSVIVEILQRQLVTRAQIAMLDDRNWTVPFESKRRA